MMCLISCFGDIWSLPRCCDVRADFRFCQGGSRQFWQRKLSVWKTSAKCQQIFFQNIFCESQC